MTIRVPEVTPVWSKADTKLDIPDVVSLDFDILINLAEGGGYNICNPVPYTTNRVIDVFWSTSKDVNVDIGARSS